MIERNQAEEYESTSSSGHIKQMTTEEHKIYFDQRFSALVEQHRDLQSLSFQTAAQHDQWVLALSGGTLGLSLTLLDKIVPHPLDETKILLFWAWGLLTVSLFAAFLGIFFSEQGINREIAKLQQRYANFVATTTPADPEGSKLPLESQNPYNLCTSLAGHIARLTTFLGIALFCLFCYQNKGQLSPEPKQEKSAVTVSVDSKFLDFLTKLKESTNDNTKNPDDKSGQGLHSNGSAGKTGVPAAGSSHDGTGNSRRTAALPRGSSSAHQKKRSLRSKDSNDRPWAAKK